METLLWYQGSANLFDLDASKLNPVNAADPSCKIIVNSLLNIGAGIYLHSIKAYIVFQCLTLSRHNAMMIMKSKYIRKNELLPYCRVCIFDLSIP